VNTVVGAADIHGARAERITGAARDHARQIGLALDHLGRRIPIRPLGLAHDRMHARPGEAFAADADAVAHRLAVAEDEIKEGVRRIDDDGAGRLTRRIGDDLALEARVHGLVHRRVIIRGGRRAGGARKANRDWAEAGEVKAAAAISAASEAVVKSLFGMDPSTNRDDCSSRQ
jgi:hypothetical protein